MPCDVLSSFSCLDELTQIVYQSIHRFVVLSSVTDDKWNIYLGLSGPEGRWWSGSWTEADILQTVGSKPSEILLEAFAKKLAESFVQGEIHIGDWSPEAGAKINLTLGPSSKKPMHVPLVEMSAVDAAAHATNVFLEIALHAQSRKCRLHAAPAEYSLASITPSITPVASHAVQEPAPQPIDSSSKVAARVQGSSQKTAKPSANTVQVDKSAQEEIKLLKAQLEKQKKRPAASIEKPAAMAPHRKGASLANPNKKARKYQAIEFESDED
ncbi:hypothetical protein BDQ12DRAFT_673043 [Crucibulum laeve]|uniref:Uncharacterized protein n=1 Tax=Crucibulum laeve TaxID=68775 RepID=A0A5C3MII4_9AGAR|nr:hypothetical protein BDQ12DRAFT_673043 [Crucibulum laeve]